MAEALSGVAYEVYAAARDAEGNRKRVTGSNHQYEASARFLLPAGRYFVTAAYGSASANVEVEVTPAGATQQIVNLRAGILRLTAVLADGGEPLARGVAYEVYTAARDAEGNRKRVTGSDDILRSPTVPAPGGTLLRDRRAQWRERQRRDSDHRRRNSRRSTTNRASHETMTVTWSYRAGSNNSMGLPSGSSTWICLPPGPVSMSFRKWRPAFFRVSMNAGRSLTRSTTRFHPPGSCR